ncbi:MAG: glycosyltransferase [Pseudomonadota bacterium]
MSAPPTISIITACYNSTAFLNRIHASLAKQEYRRFEWICVDDCSTDATVELLLRLKAPGEFGMKVFRLPENSGGSVAVQMAIARSTGDIVIILDHDDELLRGALSRIAANWGAVADDPSLSGLMFQSANPDGTIHGEILPPGERLTYAERHSRFPKASDATWAARGDLLRATATFELMEPLTQFGVVLMDLTRGRPMLVVGEKPVRIYHRDNPKSQTNFERISRKSVITYAMLADRIDRSSLANPGFWLRYIATMLRYSKLVFGRWFECLRWIKRPVIRALVVVCWPLGVLTRLGRPAPTITQMRPYRADTIERIDNLKAGRHQRQP